MELHLGSCDPFPLEIRESISELYRESFGSDLNRMEILPESRFYFAATDPTYSEIVAIIGVSDRLPYFLLGLLVDQNKEEIKFLYSLCTKPSFRRQGIMKAYLTQLFSIFPNADFYLEVDRSNTAAIQLYSDLSFTFLSSRRLGKSGEALLLRRLASA
jgi:ribosomal protein S18 acetylase RimI-like enzyme